MSAVIHLQVNFEICSHAIYSRTECPTLSPHTPLSHAVLQQNLATRNKGVCVVHALVLGDICSFLVVRTELAGDNKSRTE